MLVKNDEVEEEVVVEEILRVLKVVDIQFLHL